jgi:hypothetical protein
MLSEIEACDELFHTATGIAYADLLIDGHRESWPIRSKRFRGWLRRRHYERDFEGKCRLAQKPPRTRWPPTSRADVPAGT